MFNNKNLLILTLFLIALSATLFLTWGVPFFWEDYYLFQFNNLSFNEFLSSLKPDFFHLDYGARPMTVPTAVLQHHIFGEEIWKYRIFRAVLYSALVVMCFLFLNRFTSRTAAFLGAVFYIFVPETWFQVLYQDLGLFSHLALTISLFIFLKTYKSTRRILAAINFFIIIVLVNFSIGTKHEGRYVFFLASIFCLICYRRAIIKNLWFFLTLLLISVPVLGLLNFNRNRPLIIDNEISLDLRVLIGKFFVNFREPLFTLGIFMWAIMIISLVLLLISGIKKKNLLFWLNDGRVEGIVFSFIWFIIALVFNFLIGSWDYAPRDFQKTDYTYFWMPFTIFVFTIAYSAYYYSRKNKVFLAIVAIMIIVSFGNNLKNLNANRGAWGGYWIGLGNLREFVNKNSNQGLLLLPPMHFHPQHYFYDSKNKVELTPAYTDIVNIKELYKTGKFDNIYIADRKPLDFKTGDSVVFVASAMSVSGDLYDTFKSKLGKAPKVVFYIYQYIPQL